MEIEVGTIDVMAQTIRDLKMGVMMVAELDKTRHASFNSSVSRQNSKFRKNGENKWIKHWTNWHQNRVAAILITFDERIEMKKNIQLLKKYGTLLPQGFNDKKAKWEAGTRITCPDYGDWKRQVLNDKGGGRVAADNRGRSPQAGLQEDASRQEARQEVENTPLEILRVDALRGGYRGMHGYWGDAWTG